MNLSFRLAQLSYSGLIELPVCHPRRGTRAFDNPGTYLPLSSLFELYARHPCHGTAWTGCDVPHIMTPRSGEASIKKDADSLNKNVNRVAELCTIYPVRDHWSGG